MLDGAVLVVAVVIISWNGTRVQNESKMSMRRTSGFPFAVGTNLPVFCLLLTAIGVPITLWHITPLLRFYSASKARCVTMRLFVLETARGIRAGVAIDMHRIGASSVGGGVGRNAAAARLVFRRPTLSPLFGWSAVVRHRVKLSCWTGPAALGYGASHRFRLVPYGMRGTVTFAMSLK